MTDRHATTRVRQELKRRSLTVTSVKSLTPRMLRIVVSGDDLADFVSLGFDDHVKLFFGPVAEQGGLFAPDADPRPEMRDFTPRAYNRSANALTLDFALHQQGVATEWAERAQVGDKLDVGGPRGSMVIPDDFDWYLLVGDESALPAIGRRLEELRPKARVIVIITVAGPEEEMPLRSNAQIDVQWIHRPLDRGDDPRPLLDALASTDLPEGDGHVWVAGESAVAKAVRRYLVEERGLNTAWMKAAAYWRKGDSGIHEPLS